MRFRWEGRWMDGEEGTHGVDEFFDACAHLVFSFYGREILVYFDIRGASDIGDEVL